MTLTHPWLVLGTIGVLSATAAGDAAAVDTSQWKCESCPVEKGVSGVVDVGAAYVSDASSRSADFTGLDRKGGYLGVAGSVRYRDQGGMFARLSVNDLTPGAASLAAEGGMEGLFGLRLGYDEWTRHLTSGAMTPFLGVGGAGLTLPAGFAAGATTAMPLASALQAVDVGYRRSRLDLGATWLLSPQWAVRVNARHWARDGTQRTSGSFYANASQLVAPVDQTTDDVEVSMSYAGRRLQATLAYQVSLFRDAQPSLTWANPFTSGTVTAPLGQLALPPDSQTHQLQATLGYQFSPGTRLSADVAVGRMTQDATFLASTLNAALVVPGLPASSLQGSVDTLNAALRFTASPTDRVRLNASLTRDERDNQTPSNTYPGVSTDMFLSPAHTNRPYSFTNDRLRLSVDYLVGRGVKVVAGLDQDERQRTLQEVARTRETTVYGRVSGPVTESVSLALKLAHADRSATQYLSVPWIDPAENPLLRKYNMAERVRDSANVRADVAFSEAVSLGLDMDFGYDDYPGTVIGLDQGRTFGAGADLSVAFSEQTRLQLYAHGDRMRSRQLGSLLQGRPDWSARNKDDSAVVGVGLRHAAIKDKLDLGGDLTMSRSRSQVSVDTAALGDPFPTVTTAVDSLKLFANYRMSATLSLTASYAFQRWDAQDWRLDGVLPATIPNLLAFGEQPPHYRVSVVQLAMRYRF